MDTDAQRHQHIRPDVKVESLNGCLIYLPCENRFVMQIDFSNKIYVNIP